MDIPQHLRQIVVTGVPTAGKTKFSSTLAKRDKMQHIGIDPIITALTRSFPSLGIGHGGLTYAVHAEKKKRTEPFFAELLHALRTDHFVLDGYMFPLEEMCAKFPSIQYIVFAYPNATPEQELALCRQYDVYNWTVDHSDAELLQMFSFYIEESKRLQQFCAEKGIRFYDTSYAYTEVITAALEETNTGSKIAVHTSPNVFTNTELPIEISGW